MVKLEPTQQYQQSGSFQQVDPVAALQQLSLQNRAAHAGTARTVQKDTIACCIPHLPHSVVQPPKIQHTAEHAKFSSQHTTFTRPRSIPHTYATDGMRLSELGEVPLSVGTPRPPVFEEEELSFSLPAPSGVPVSDDSFAGVPKQISHSQRKKYVCSIKDDPLVKGRPALPDLFRQEGAFTFLQPALASDLSFAQLHSQRDSQPPVLLVNLQAFLAEKLHSADRLQAAYGGQDRSSLATANLILDAHRQVFEAFIHSFTTYRPLLLKIRAAFEEALQDALSSQADNIHMKAQLAVLHQCKADAIDKARGSGNDAAVSGRGALYQRLLEAQGRQEQASASAAAEEAANAAATAELRAARAEAADLKMRIMKARSTMYASSSFAQQHSPAPTLADPHGIKSPA